MKTEAEVALTYVRTYLEDVIASARTYSAEELKEDIQHCIEVLKGAK